MGKWHGVGTHLPVEKDYAIGRAAEERKLAVRFAQCRSEGKRFIHMESGAAQGGPLISVVHHKLQKE